MFLNSQRISLNKILNTITVSIKKLLAKHSKLFHYLTATSSDTLQLLLWIQQKPRNQADHFNCGRLCCFYFLSNWKYKQQTSAIPHHTCRWQWNPNIHHGISLTIKSVITRSQKHGGFCKFTWCIFCNVHFWCTFIIKFEFKAFLWVPSSCRTPMRTLVQWPLTWLVSGICFSCRSRTSASSLMSFINSEPTTGDR